MLIKSQCLMTIIKMMGRHSIKLKYNLVIFTLIFNLELFIICNFDNKLRFLIPKKRKQKNMNVLGAKLQS